MVVVATLPPTSGDVAVANNCGDGIDVVGNTVAVVFGFTMLTGRGVVALPSTNVDFCSATCLAFLHIVYIIEVMVSKSNHPRRSASMMSHRHLRSSSNSTRAILARSVT